MTSKYNKSNAAFSLAASYFITFALIILLSACQHQTKYRIGVSQCSSDDWRNKMNEEIMRETMFHDNIDVEIRSGEDNNDKQIADLKYFVDNGFDIIIVAPNEADALTPAIKEIYDSGIPVVLFDRTINGKSYTAFQGADNAEIGGLAAQMAFSMLGSDCKALEIYGLEGSSPATERRRGFDSAAASLGIDILAGAYGNWNKEEGALAAESLLVAYPDANLIFAHNDRMAIAASETARQLGRDIKVIGVDAAPSIGIQAVADSIIDATFLYPTSGEQLIRTAICILEGKPYVKDRILATPAAVDKSNAEILLLQDENLRDETNKINVLKGRIEKFWEEHSLQTAILYAVFAILILVAGLLFVVLRYYWASKHHRAEMVKRNAELARQRDELDNLYRHLQDATASKLTFYTNVSHDLRTPLTLIADPVHVMASADNITDDQRMLMQLADKNVKRLQRLINQILDIRKYESNQLQLRLENVDMAASMKEWSLPFADAAKRRHIKFGLNVEQASSYVTAIDVEKIERVLFNLLSNAFKFTPENGSICVNLSRIDDKILISVSDSGVGINANEINHIFERFFKTDHINPNGSGIGLALSKIFVDMHGGTIAVDSTEGKGTTFTVELPVKQVDEPVHTASLGNININEIEEVNDETSDEEIEISEDTPAVLIIDDNRDICTLVKSVLSGSYIVLTAHSGAQGIRLSNKYLPDLIICDVMMPGTDGYEVCRSLKQDPLTSHIPVLLLTACSRDQQRIQGYDCGADGYMSKPFDSAMLLSRIKSLIENRQRIYHNLEATPAAPQNKAEKVPKANIEDEFLQKFTAHVETNISNQDLSVENIADNLGLSRVQLYRKIKSLTNYSAAEMVRIIRLKKANKMLKTSTATVSEIAYSVGFSSPSYFSKCYKEYFNEAPVDTQNRTSKKR